MPSGYRVAGVDLDDLFDPYVTGTSPAPTGYRVAGVDIATRYAPLTYGTIRPTDTGYRIAGGADIRTLFAAAGTAAYVSATAGLPTEIYALAAGSSGPLTATATFSLARNGTTSWSPPTSASAWYTAAPPGIGDLYEVRFTVLSGVGGTLTGSTTGVWLTLNTDRGLTLTRTASSAATATRDILTEIRRIGTVPIVGTQTTTMTCEVVIA